MLDAIPIIAYYGVDNNSNPFSTNIILFDVEMKYLYDNGFRVIPMSNLKYDQSINYMYIKSQ